MVKKAYTMSFGISNNIRSREVRECTPELFWKAVRSPLVADICAQIAYARRWSLISVRR